MHVKASHPLGAAVVSCTLLASCGGGGSANPVGGGGGGGGGGGPDYSARIAAATATAENNAECVSIKPFYWEVGDRTSALAGGSAGSNRYGASTEMSIASASKWLYSSYWVQRTNGVLSADDIRYFNFYSGYTQFSSCLGANTVVGCLSIGSNDVFDPVTSGRFDYGGGHMQKHAALNGLGLLDNAGLAAEIRSQIGPEIQLRYGQPQLAGGGNTSAAEYAKLLRKIVGGQLVMSSVLGTHRVCASKNTCPAGTVVSSPAPPNENWSYSVGHWVEDPANVSDGAFSSPGAFGFYPWVDKTKTWYGIVAREDFAGTFDSIQCGRLIRRAWVTSTAQ